MKRILNYSKNYIMSTRNSYYIIRTDDWDRYYYEIYLNDEMVYIASTRKDAEQYIEEHK